MFALAFLTAAMAQPRMFLAPAGYQVQQVQQVPVVVNPAMLAAQPRASEPVMIIDESAFVVQQLPQTTTLVAASASDFGGYTIPIIGLAILAATIGLLAGPVED